MTSQEMTAVLMLLTPQIILMLSERRKADYKEATRLLYTSKLYSKLENAKTGLWHLSVETLYSLLDEELTTGKIVYPEEQ
ncbi:MAG: hypothetical protein LBT55_00425 [Clostridiaceae bacterium]|jgi:hypothetical protein|nr:hypothetical protein [Clostridiaceae bacterium]